jgi:hypothetical protein
LSGIIISPSAVSGSVTNSGVIKAASVYLSSSAGNVYALAGNNGGLIEATGSKTINGQVWLTAPKGTVTVSSPVKSSSNIYIDGTQGTDLTSSSSIYSNGGDIKIGLFPSLPESLVANLSSGSLIYNPNGSVETSGDTLNMGDVTVNVKNWLLDPADFTIDSSNNTTIDNALGSGNVTITTTSGTPAASPSLNSGSYNTNIGDINVDAPLSWSSANTLTLSAYHSINIYLTITATGTPSKTPALVLTYNNNNGGTSSGGSLNFSGGSIDFPGGTNASGGSTSAPYGSLTLNGTSYILLNDYNLSTVGSTGDYALATDITLPAPASGSNSNFTPIGESTAFTGIFTGLGNTISNLIIGTHSTPYNGTYAGLFGLVGSGGTVENTGLVNESIYDNKSPGFVGGIVGWNNSTLTDSYSTGSVTGPNYVGGLVGYNSGGTVTDSYSTGSVSGSSEVGGIVGFNSGGTVTDSYSTGSVTGSNTVGGLVGYNGGTVTDSYSTGSVTGSNHTGGLVGYKGGTVSDSYWDINSSKQSSSAGGTGLTDAQMKESSNFTGWTGTNAIDPSYTGGSTSDAWYQSNGYSYPLLVSTNIVGTPIAIYNGTIMVPYTLVNASNIDDIGVSASYPLTGNYAIMYDIKHPNTILNPIGESTAFTGIFNGLGNTISNLNIDIYRNLNSRDYAGLFGRVGQGGTVENVGLVNERVGNYLSTREFVEIKPFGYTGGLVGANFGTVSDSYSTGIVVGTYCVGGLVGANYGTVSDSYSTSTVIGRQPLGSAVGGLVGDNFGTVFYSYSTGTVIGFGEHNAVGGLVGGDIRGRVSDSYWDINSSKQSSSGGGGTGHGGTGLTDAQMKNFAANTDWTTTNDILTELPSSSTVTTVWVQYPGETYPLLAAFMASLTVSANTVSSTYNGSPYTTLPSSVNYNYSLFNAYSDIVPNGLDNANEIDDILIPILTVYEGSALLPNITASWTNGKIIDELENGSKFNYNHHNHKQRFFK